MTEVMFFSILLAAMFSTRSNKRYGRDAAEFERCWAPLLVRMMYELWDKTFRIAKNYAFLVSIPKWREIFATIFQGRIADHLICDPLKPYLEKELYDRTYNNREGKGSQAAINQVIEDIYEVTEGYTKPARIIKFDLQGCFPNALLDIIEKCFCAVIDKYSEEIAAQYDEDYPAFLKWLTMIAVHCCPAKHCELRSAWWLWPEHIKPEKSLLFRPDGVGAPIGRLTSQMGMGLYLNHIVRWLNEECGIRTVLFMDDFVMVVPERLHGYALSLFPVLRGMLAELGLRMNEKKFYDQPYTHGLEFLGSHIKPGRILINDSTYKRCVARIELFNAIDDKYKFLDRFVSTVNSYTGLLKNRTEYRRIQALRDVISPEWWEWLEWDEKRLCVRFRRDYTLNRRLSIKYNLQIKFKGYETGRKRQTA